MTRTVPRRVLTASCTLVALGLLTGCAGAADGAQPAPSPTATAATESDPLAPLAESATVVIGVPRTVNTAPVWAVKEYAAAYNVEVAYVEFQRFADMRTALAADEIDFAPIGPQDIGLALVQNQDTIVALAGMGQGNDAIVMAKGAGFEDWADLEGARVGIGAGSSSWVKFAASVEERDDIDYSSLEIVNVAGGGSAYVQALERGEIDLAVVWEPFAAQAVVQGVGEYPPFTHNESELIGGEYATFTTSATEVEQRPEVVQRVLNAYVDAVEAMQEDRSIWVETASGYVDLEPSTIEKAIEGSHLGYEMHLDLITNMVEFLIESGAMNDIDVEAMQAAHDYSFLEARTGLTASELGKP